MKNNIDKLETIVLEELGKFRHDPNVDVQEPDVFLAIEENGEEIPICTAGNFSLLIGKPKSRKTTLLSIFGATILNKDRQIKILKSICISEKVLWVDTEQNAYHLSRNLHSLAKMVDDDLSNIIAYRFRNVDPTDRFTHIKTLITYYVKQGVRVVVIDGIADLLTKGYNDEEEAIKISNFLLKYTEDYNIHIITVLHENKGNGMAKGHIGSYLIQKSESVLSVSKNEKDKQFSEVSSNFTRGKDFSSFFISYDENDIPCIVSDSTRINTSKKATEPDQLEDKTHMNVLTECFSDENNQLLRSQLIVGIRKELEEYGVYLSENKAIKWLNFYKEKEWIIQNSHLQNKPYSLSIN
jgi:AAA domain-containing protein